MFSLLVALILFYGIQMLPRPFKMKPLHPTHLSERTRTQTHHSESPKKKQHAKQTKTKKKIISLQSDTNTEYLRGWRKILEVREI